MFVVVAIVRGPARLTEAAVWRLVPYVMAAVKFDASNVWAECLSNPRHLVKHVAAAERSSKMRAQNVAARECPAKING